MIFAILLYVLCALWLIIGFLFGMRRGAAKAAGWLGINLVTLFWAVLLSSLLSSAVMPLVRERLVLSETVRDLPALLDPMLAMMQMVLAAVLYPILFFPIRWIFKAIGLLILHKSLPEEETKPLKFSPIGAGLGVLSAFLVMCAFFAPMAELSGNANTVAAALQTGDIENERFAVIRKQYIEPIAEHPIMVLGRVVGGPCVTAPLTTVKSGGVTTNLRVEAGAMTEMLDALLPIAGKGQAQIGSEALAAAHDAVDAFGRSRLLPNAAVSFLHIATEAWSRDEAFLGVTVPDLGASVTPTAELILENFGSTTPEGLRESLHTAVSLLEVLERHGVLSKAESEQEGALMEALSEEGLVEDIVLCVSEDASLRVLVPELVNICLRTMGDALGMKQDAAQVYGELMIELAEAMQISPEQTKAQRLAVLTDAVYEIGERYGLNITPAGAFYLSACLMSDFAEASDPTPAEMSAWFAAYAGVDAEGAGNPTFGGADGTAIGNIACSATFKGAYPVSITAFSLSGAEVTVWGMSDASLYAYTADQTLHRFPSVQALSAAFEGVVLQMGADGERGMIQACEARDAADFRLTVPPRRVSAAEAARANALASADRSALDAVEDLQETVGKWEDAFCPVPSCVKTALEQRARASGSAVSIPDTVSSPRALIEIVRTSALQNGMSTGGAQTLTDAASMRTSRITLEDMLLDSRKISENLPSLDRKAIAKTMADMFARMLKVLRGEQISPELIADMLDGIQQVMQALDPASSPSLIGGILQSDSIREIIQIDGGALIALSDKIAFGSADAKQIFNDLMQTLSLLGQDGEGEDGTKQGDLTSLLTDISPQGAQAIGDVMTPDLLESLGVSSAQGAATLTSEIFTRLAALKKSGDTESFDREAEGMKALLGISTEGDEQKDGMTGEEMVSAVLSSDVISESLLATVSDSVASREFSVRSDAEQLLLQSAISDSHRKGLRRAMENYWTAHSASLPEARNASELASVTGGKMTKTDLARRIAAVGAVFGVEYDNPYLDLKEEATVRVLTLRGKGEGEILIECKQNGDLTVTAQNGGVEGLCTENGEIGEEVYADWIIRGAGNALTVNPTLYETVDGLAVIVRDCL